ncbi:kinase-like domain-containing protein [Schizophyllum commune]
MDTEQAPATDAYGFDTQPDEPTQQTQQDSQSQPPPDDHLWGYLIPHNPTLIRCDFFKIQARYRVGRRAVDNDLVFPGTKISNNHAIIHWDGTEGPSSRVTVTDLSSNGTYIGGVKVGRNQTAILKDGVEICFGSPHTQLRNNGLEDYRFTFRNLAQKKAEMGIYQFYDIDADIGSGSFATVKRAIHRASGTWYAVKIIQRKHRQDSQNEAFARETTVMEQLKHPNIVMMKDTFFEEDGCINIVMELMDGGDLLQYILDNEGLTEYHTQQIAYQISDALAYIHAIGIAHRDLKPENVLLTRVSSPDEVPIAKVADFGLAKIVSSMTMLKTMCGTPSYLAPEVVKGDAEGYSVQVDSWSVGVIVFSAITNASPFLEDESMDIRTRIMTRQVDWNLLREPPKHLDTGVSELCQRFIRDLLVTDPNDRLAMRDAPSHEWFNARNGFTPLYGYAQDHLAEAPQPSQSQSQSQASAFDFGSQQSASSNQGYAQQQQPVFVQAQAFGQQQAAFGQQTAVAGSAPRVSEDVSMLTTGAGGQGSTTEGGAADEEVGETDAEGGGGGDEGEDEQDGEGADAVMAGASTATIMGGPTVLSAPGTAARKRIRAELSEDAVMASPVKRGRTNEDADEAESADANPLDMAAPAPRSRRTRKMA